MTISVKWSHPLEHWAGTQAHLCMYMTNQHMDTEESDVAFLFSQSSDEPLPSLGPMLADKRAGQCWGEEQLCPQSWIYGQEEHVKVVTAPQL